MERKGEEKQPKFHKIFKCNWETCHKLCLKVTKFDCSSCNLNLQDFLRTIQNFPCMFYKIRAIKFT